MSEAAFWELFRGHVAPFGRLVRVEDRLARGTPDAAYCLSIMRRPAASGWIEFKHLARWPARAGTPVLLEKFTLDQALWLQRWAAADGRAWLCARIEDDIVICNPAVARLLRMGELTQARLRAGATLCAPLRPFPLRQVLEVLTG